MAIEHGSFPRYVMTAMVNFVAFYALVGNFRISTSDENYCRLLLGHCLVSRFYKLIGRIEFGLSIPDETSNGRFRQQWLCTSLEELALPHVITSARFLGD